MMTTGIHKRLRRASICVAASFWLTASLSASPQEAKDDETMESAAGASSSTETGGTPESANGTVVKKVPSGMDKVKESYNTGKYKDALDMLAKMKPDGWTHYYTGLCYQGQGQMKPAAGEFQWVIYYSKDQQLKSYAQVALKSLSRAYAKKHEVRKERALPKKFYYEKPIACYKCGALYMKSTSRCLCPTDSW